MAGIDSVATLIVMIIIVLFLLIVTTLLIIIMCYFRAKARINSSHDFVNLNNSRSVSLNQDSVCIEPNPPPEQDLLEEEIPLLELKPKPKPKPKLRVLPKTRLSVKPKPKPKPKVKSKTINGEVELENTTPKNNFSKTSDISSGLKILLFYFNIL
jgi:outer membrane biosynthesis protein TonB